mgnify:CR=1 FL=1
MSQFTIGRAAEAAGVNVETVRFYERKGLIEQPPKPLAGGFREYDAATVARIRFVRQAQEIGFSLGAIADLLELRADPAADCAEVRARALEKRDGVQAKLEQLIRIRQALDTLIANCPGGGAIEACTILDAIESGASTAPNTPRSTNTPSKSQETGMKTTILNIDGMHCDGCARTIEALLSRVEGVRKAEASFDEGRARVLHDPASAPEAELAAALAKGGFKAKAAEK